MRVYRLSSRLYPAYSGEGARRLGGRWNPVGVPVVYASENRALCALEVLVNNGVIADDLVVTPIEIPDHVGREELQISDLPEGWNAPRTIDATREIGAAWQSTKAIPILVVPSATMPAERNFLLNPEHPDFAQIIFHPSEEAYFDERFRSR